MEQSVYECSGSVGITGQVDLEDVGMGSLLPVHLRVGNRRRIPSRACRMIRERREEEGIREESIKGILRCSAPAVATSAEDGNVHCRMGQRDR